MTTSRSAIIYEIDDINSISLFADLFAKKIHVCNTIERLKQVLDSRPDKSMPARILVTKELAAVYKEWLALMN
jgi:hypothetical protein